MNGKPLTEAPTLDELVSNPGLAATLPPEAAQALLIGLVSLQPLLIQRALLGPQNVQEENLLDAQQVAVRLNVPVSYVYELARQKKLTVTKLGKKYVRFTEAAVQVYCTTSWS